MGQQKEETAVKQTRRNKKWVGGHWASEWVADGDGQASSDRDRHCQKQEEYNK